MAKQVKEQEESAPQDATVIPEEALDAVSGGAEKDPEFNHTFS